VNDEGEAVAAVPLLLVGPDNVPTLEISLADVDAHGTLRWQKPIWDRRPDVDVMHVRISGLSMGADGSISVRLLYAIPLSIGGLALPPPLHGVATAVDLTFTRDGSLDKMRWIDESQGCLQSFSVGPREETRADGAIIGGVAETYWWDEAHCGPAGGHFWSVLARFEPPKH
jgi:hypothetical protein